VWPRSTRRSRPPSASKIETVPSSDAAARRRPSGNQATPFTSLVWCAAASTHSPLARNTRTLPSNEAEATRAPSGEKRTSFTSSL
jgi:hypothetical protein